MFLISGGSGLCGGVLGTSVAYALGRINTGYRGVIMVELSGGEKDVASLCQEDFMCNRRELVEVRGGYTGAVTILE